MSVSWYAGVFYGVVMESFRKTSKVTKYNPDTGVPYQKSVEGIAYRLPAVADQKGCEISLDVLEEAVAEEFLFGGYYNDNKLFGIPVVSTYAHNGCTTTAPLSVEDLAVLNTRFRELIGNTFDAATTEKLLDRAELSVFIYGC